MFSKKIDPRAVVANKLEAAFDNMKQFSEDHKDEKGLNLVSVIFDKKRAEFFVNFPAENMTFSKTGMPQGNGYEKANFSIDADGNVLASPQTRDATKKLEERFKSVIDEIHKCQADAKFSIKQDLAEGKKLKK